MHLSRNQTEIKRRTMAQRVSKPRKGRSNYGPLDDRTLRQGVDVCLNYAKRLTSVIELLADREPGLSFSLACIRVEELGKALLLAEMRQSKNGEDEWKSFWHDFRNHSAKWRKYWGPIFQQFDLEIEKNPPWSSAKNDGLYVEYHLGVGLFSDPQVVPAGFLPLVLQMGEDLERRVENIYEH